MARTKGSKNKPKGEAGAAAKPKGKDAKNKKKPAAAAAAKRKPEPAAGAAAGPEVGKSGQARRVISENNLRSLMRSCASLKRESDSVSGSLREKIAYSCEHHYLDKGVFALIRRLDKMEPEKLLLFLENLEHYLEVSGLNDRADSVGKLPLTNATDGENDDDEGEKPGAGGAGTSAVDAEQVSRPQGISPGGHVADGPGGTVHVLPDRKAAAAS